MTTKLYKLGKHNMVNVQEMCQHKKIIKTINRPHQRFSIKLTWKHYFFFIGKKITEQELILRKYLNKFQPQNYWANYHSNNLLYIKHHKQLYSHQTMLSHINMGERKHISAHSNSQNNNHWGFYSWAWGKSNDSIK